MILPFFWGYIMATAPVHDADKHLIQVLPLERKYVVSALILKSASVRRAARAASHPQVAAILSEEAETIDALVRRFS